MKRLFGLAMLALVLLLVYSVGGEMWRSLNFDSKFSGYVQNAVRVPPREMENQIRQVAADAGVDISQGSLSFIQRGAGYEVSLRYPVRLGIGGFCYVWNREVIARTRLGGLAHGRGPLRGDHAWSARIS